MNHYSEATETIRHDDHTLTDDQIHDEAAAVIRALDARFSRPDTLAIVRHAAYLATQE